MGQLRKPIVAVVGRPNVGKSTLFNYIAGKRISIVDDTPGVTRDRIYLDTDWNGRDFILIDTGGIEPYSEDEIMQQMKLQAEMAIETADVIVFMVDMKEGMTASDMEVSNILRKTGKPVILTVNKVDNIGNPPDDVYEFYNLGIGDPLCISSVHGLGIGDLLDEVHKNFPDISPEEMDDSIIKVAVVGKPNAGKSTLINRILGEERLIVSDIPGTTRDAIDTYKEIDDKKYMFIDTAGIRRKSRITEAIEKYSVIRSWTAVERSDVCIILIDAVEGITEQDKKIAGFAHEQGKAAIIAVNKWDLYKKGTGTLEKFEKEIKGALAFMSYAPVVFISAKSGKRVDTVYEMIDYVYNESCKRISTGMLNDMLYDAMAMVQPPSDKGKRLKIYYITQSGVRPPKFVFFVNKIDLFHFSYARYMENKMRESFGFDGTPIKFIFREKTENDKQGR
jgi:GTP-binding protein